MWCDRCRADAAAEVSAQTGRAACVICGSDLGPIRRPATAHARDLLKKWSAGIDLEAATSTHVARLTLDDLDDIGDTVNIGDAVKAAAATVPLDVPMAGRPSRHPSGSPMSAAPTSLPPALDLDTTAAGDAEPTLLAMPSATEPESTPKMRIDTPHAGGASPPHFDVHTAISARTEKRGNGTHIVGQILAYAGVLALTIGTALVIWSYFGEVAEYAPTGWLVATGGQMLLFLGVVTLVASGLEQTNHDVRVRIDSLGERLVRIEQTLARQAESRSESDAESPRSRSAGHDRTRQRAG